jgi:hypothetical protein
LERKKKLSSKLYIILFHFQRADPSFCNPNIELNDKLTTATAGGRYSFFLSLFSKLLSGSNWQCVLLNKPMKNGVHKWEVVVDHTTTVGSSYIMLGVCEQHQILTTYPGNDASCAGWSYYGASPGIQLFTQR